MFDVVFISFDEPNSDENWEKLLEIASHASRVHGIKGIPKAHIEAASQVNTSHFFTVDADNVVDENFNWEKIVDFRKNDQRIHVWNCRNAVNGLVYGYGGVKLWPTEHVENIKKNSVDFTTSVATHGFKIHDKVASTTFFNSTPYNAWKSGFRECVKLASGIINNPDKDADEKNRHRLLIWTSLGMDEKYGDYCLLGARMGTLYGLENAKKKSALAKINNFSWLKKLYEEKDKEVELIMIGYWINKLNAQGIDSHHFNEKESKIIKNLRKY